MMRELDTVSPVVWPAWCYSGEGPLDTEAADATVPSAGAGGRKGGGRGGGGGGGSCTPTGAAMNGAGASAGASAPASATPSAASDSQPPAAAVKTERLSPQGPCTPGGGGGGGGQQGAASSNSSTASSNSTANQHHQSGALDNNSTSSRSGTPGSSYAGTPPERAASPHPLKTEHLARNYSDFMRSLAAKYNNANPNDYLSSAAAAAAAAAATGARNGYLDARFAPFKPGAATPFVGLMAPLPAPASPLPGFRGGLAVGPAPAGSPKEEQPAGRKGGAGAAGAGGPPTPAPTPAPAADLLGMFPPMIDMSSTQALLSMVRSANASQLENYLKGASSRRPAESSPLDLSPGAVVPPPGKRRAYHAPSRSLGESLFASKDTHRLRRLGSVSPKPRPPAPPSAAPAAPGGGARVLPCPSLCGAASAATCAPDAAATAAWTVDDVAAFVGSIDLCAEYAQNFREQRIDGCALPLLTEEHLTGALGMRLGPALKLRAALSRRLGQCAACAHCLHCHAPQPQQPSSAGHSPTSRPASTGV